MVLGPAATRRSKHWTTTTASALNDEQTTKTEEGGETVPVPEPEVVKKVSEKSASQLRSPRAKKRKGTSKSNVEEKLSEAEDVTNLVDEIEGDLKPAIKKSRSGSQIKSPVGKRKIKGEENSDDVNGGDEDEEFQMDEDESVEAEGDPDQNLEEDDESFEEEEDASRPRRKAAARQKNQKKKLTAAGRGPEEERTCPHCKKTIVSKAGLKYHLDNFVCRIDQCPNPELVAKAKRKRGKSEKGLVGERGSKRFRGPIEDRTCPDCKRIFTSALGCNYHVKHKVCKATAAPRGKKRADKRTNMGILERGSRFVTQFGVVEVAKDDRATPTKTLPDDLQIKTRHYCEAKARTESQNARIMELIAANSRIRRAKVNIFYKTGNLSKATIFNAYFGEYPRYTEHSQQPLTIHPMPSDPAIPDNFCPDRMVECILVPDRRTQNLSSGETLTYSTENEIQPKSPTRLFLQRRLLVETYHEDLPTYQCMDCGQRFISSTGMKHHFQNKTCSSKNSKAGEKRLDRSKTIDKMVSVIAAGDSKLTTMIPKSRRQVDNKQRKKGKKKRELSMYPEVLISLGFKVVKTDMTFDEDLPLPAFNDLVNIGSEDNHDAAGSDNSVDGMGLTNPKAVLDQIRNQLADEQREYQRTAANQKHGSMYTAVFKSLGFKKAPKARESGDGMQPGTRRRRRRTSKEVPVKPLPPIIDTRALIDEVESGRYPSFKRNNQDNHGDICVICKEGGELVCCDYCSNAEHMKCILSRFTVKEPEPDDDFLCHKCIGMILSRRNRAEKRRLMKQQRDDQLQEQEALEDARRNPGIQPGMEYPYMAARGQELSELVEILQDAQTRLNQSLAISKMNSIRRKAMGCFYNVKS